MRRLWIKRHKAYAGCLAKMKVYIEDPQNGDTTINDVLCRKLGEIKNGQQKHFTIGEGATKIFVVADKLSRNLYNEFMQIPAGREDVFLSGKNYLSPFSGNPFRFDGVTDEETLKNRKRVKRGGSVLLIVTILVGILVGAGVGGAVGAALVSDADSSAEEPKTFEAQGLQITLTDAFAEMDVNGYTACYSSSDTAVFVLREDFSLMEGFGDLSLDAYGAMVLANNGFDQSVTLQEEDGLAFFGYVYTNPDNGENYYYCCNLFKGPDAFWMVQFSVPAEIARESIPVFKQWAKTVAFPV